MFFTLLVNALIIGCLYGLVALGYSLIYRASGLMTFVHGEVMMLGAFFGYTFYDIFSLPFGLAFVATLVLLFFIGVIMERGVVQRLTKNKTDLIFISIATMGLSMMLRSLAKTLWGSRNFRFPPIFTTEIVQIGSVRLQSEALLGGILSICFMVALTLFMNKTKLGTAMRAAAQDSMAASVMGINTGMTTYTTWGISSCVAAVAGMVIGPMTGISFNMGNMMGLKGFAAAVIGGYGNMYGAIAGGLIIGLIETFTSGLVSSSYKDVVSFVALIIVLAFKPTGLFSEKTVERA
jgi:branched-chain amino acid transport system permease protein